MKVTLLTIFLHLTLANFGQSVKQKARAIMKEYNLPAEVHVVYFPDSTMGLIIGIKAIDTAADLTEYYRDMTQPIATKLRYKAIADSAHYFNFLSINYTSLTKKAITFNFKMNDKLFKR